MEKEVCPIWISDSHPMKNIPEKFWKYTASISANMPIALLPLTIPSFRISL